MSDILLNNHFRLFGQEGPDDGSNAGTQIDEDETMHAVSEKSFDPDTVSMPKKKIKMEQAAV